MKRLLFILLILTTCCKSNDYDIKPQLREVIINYQKKYPIPNSIKDEGAVYVYSIVFKKENKDTIISITRSSSGILPYPYSKGSGVYKDEELRDSYIYDENNLSFSFISKKKGFVDSKYYIHSESFKESYPPVYTYLVKNEKLSLMKIDTVWSRWD